jgi:Leucine-rich repeat (LRR) protein
MTENELEELIAQAKQGDWTELNLSGQSLTSLPTEMLLRWLPNMTNLQSLDLSATGLTALPDWLVSLPNLQSLNLNYNNLRILPEWMAKLTKLQSLYLGSTNLTVLPDLLANLQNLQILDISYNRLTVLPEWLVNLSDLHSLYLSGNQISVLPDELANLIHLHTLALSGNQISTLPEGLANLIQLQILNLSKNELKTLPKWLASLTDLRALYLSVNKLTALPRELLTNLTELSTLALSSNEIEALPEELANLTKLEILDLSNNKLMWLPEGLSNLTRLRSLYLSDNNLIRLPEGLANLTDIQSLYLNGNQLMTLPDGIANLTKLQTLHLGGNKLTVLPKGLSNLTDLRLLSLSGNEIKTLPDWLANLTNLHSLNLNKTGLTTLAKGLDGLINLQVLNLGANKLTNLPDWLIKLANLHSLDLRDNKLTELPEWLVNSEKLPQLSSLYIGRNPLTVPPVELLGHKAMDDYAVNVSAIRSYFRQLQEVNAVYFYEAKVLIIGEGGAGKSSLARKLVEPNCQLKPDEKSTEGIAILTWQFALPPTTGDGDYTVNLWDFGGQEIYFATHQFFLTRRSVYLLVADTRRQHTDFYTWLRMQETFGEDSPLLLVKNRNRQHGNSFSIENLPQLRERFQNLKEIIEVDLNEAPADNGWKELLRHIQLHLLQLPHIGQPRPSTWVAVREALKHHQQDIIQWSDFVKICKKKGMKREPDIEQLAEYLHNLGDILYFHEDPVLRDHVILKPTWGLDAVYKVLDNKKIEKQFGQFSYRELRTLWRNRIYTGYHVHLLRLMENFQLCYPLPDVKDTYIAPQLLTEDPPRYDWEEDENLQLRYAYRVFMPRGILSRVIVKLHSNIEAQRLVWRSGVILNDGYARAEILELRGEQQIRIRVSGRKKRDMLMEIVRTLDELHRGFPKLQFERLVPCICDTCCQRSEPYFFSLDILLERHEHRKETIECRYPPFIDVPIESLLSEIRPLNQRPDLRGDTFINNYYGDHIKVGDISDATGVALGRRAAAKVKSQR